jgi:hypothetical protein
VFLCYHFFFLILFLFLLIDLLDVILTSPRLASARATRAVFALGVTRTASSTAAAGGATVAVARSVVFALDYDFVVVLVVAVNEEGEKL